MVIGIGSTNQTKVSACWIATGRIAPLTGLDLSDIEIRSFSTRTSVPDMPLTEEEIREGARQRALFLYNEFPGMDICLGLEGGVFIPKNLSDKAAFLQNWVYAYNGKTGYYGSSPALPVPDTISHALYKEKRELAEVIDAFSGKHDIRSKEGAFGILSANLITRTDSFVSAVVCALTPLLVNSGYYR